MAKLIGTKVITNKVRFSYAHVFKPHAVEEGQDPKYSVSILIPKKDKETVKLIQSAIERALEEGKSKFGGKLPKKWKNPLRDGDEEREDDENYEGMFFVNANSTTKPGIVDSTGENAITGIEDEDEEDFYSGCYGRASINFYAFSVSGNKGVACGLNNLQKLEDGDRLGGSRASAEEDFADDDLL